MFGFSFDERFAQVLGADLRSARQTTYVHNAHLYPQKQTQSHYLFCAVMNVTVVNLYGQTSGIWFIQLLFSFLNKLINSKFQCISLHLIAEDFPLWQAWYTNKETIHLDDLQAILMFQNVYKIYKHNNKIFGNDRPYG